MRSSARAKRLAQCTQSPPPSSQPAAYYCGRGPDPWPQRTKATLHPRRLAPSGVCLTRCAPTLVLSTFPRRCLLGLHVHAWKSVACSVPQCRLHLLLACLAKPVILLASNSHHLSPLLGAPSPDLRPQRTKATLHPRRLAPSGVCLTRCAPTLVLSTFPSRCLLGLHVHTWKSVACSVPQCRLHLLLACLAKPVILLASNSHHLSPRPSVVGPTQRWGRGQACLRA
jgi:hypothetical protein